MSRGTLPLLLALTPALAGCMHEELISYAPTTAMTAIAPAGGAVDVDPAGGVTVSFSRPLAPGMERFAALHVGDLGGDLVAGRWTLSADGSTLAFTPSAPLARATAYAIHLGGGLKDTAGRDVDLATGRALGGRWATAAMMSAASPGSPAVAMVGYGWLAPDGTYGMIFTFRTS
jgi:hypothetical protein